MTSNVTRYEKRCDEIWQAMWQALWQYCLCKGLLVKVHLFLATYFCLQWRSKYFRPKLRSKSRYTSWHLTYSVREKLLHIIWTLKWKATYIFTYIMTTKMVIFDNIWQGKIWQLFDDMWRGKMWQLFDDIWQRKIWQIFGDVWQGKIWEPVPPASPPRLQPGRSFASLICGAQPATLDKLR